jgi:hypothetical protein
MASDGTPNTSAGAGPGSGQAGRTDPCGNLTFVANLNSPEPEVVDQLAAGMELSIVLVDDDGVPLVEAQTEDDQTAGTITDELPDLLPCLEAGWEYRAIVERIDGGLIEVRIQPRP